MRTPLLSSPHIHRRYGINLTMMQVLAALLPGVVGLVIWFGSGVVVQIILAVTTALLAEALMLSLRDRPLKPFLSDGSAVVTAVLLAVALPPFSPWWLIVIGTGFAMVVGKHLYGGLGHNPFNPAMVGYVILLISYPLEMSLWPTPTQTPDIATSLALIFSNADPLDGWVGATALDTVRTGLAADQPLEAIMTDPAFGLLAGQGWEWANLGFLLGGLWLVYSRAAAWQIPAGMLGGLTVCASLGYLLDPLYYPSPAFHLAAGAAIFGAFFIATDPVSAATSPRGRWIFGAGVGILTFVIRSYGGYPDGVAFAVLLMNITVPVLDYYTQPPVFGRQT